MELHIPEGVVPVELLAPATDAAGRTSTLYASLKNAMRAWIVFHVAQGNAATITITPVQATAVAGTGSKVLTAVVPIWLNALGATASTFTRQTDAANLTTSAALTHKIVVFQIDPAACMDINNAFDCIGLTTGASDVANITSAMLYVESKYKQATPPDFLSN